jgi:mannosyltransferase OCH1-like enzyme
MSKIPKIIHQIWSGVSEPLPERDKLLGETWKEHYPDWEYMFWDNNKMNEFIEAYYPQYVDIYNRFPYNVQRWDAIRYLILDKIGGMYVDFDYESICNMEELIQDKSCYFALEPQLHTSIPGHERVDPVFNNALMLCEPEHPFMKRIIEKVFSEKMLTFEGIKTVCVLSTTGPWMINDLYYYESTKQEQEDIYLIPAKYVTPFTMRQAQRFRFGEMSEELESCLGEAYAIHYFFSDWVKTGS